MESIRPEKKQATEGAYESDRKSDLKEKKKISK